MLNLKSLTPAEVPLIAEFLGRYPRVECDYNVCNLMTWGRIYDNRYLLWRDRMVFFNSKYSYVFFPVGPEPSVGELCELFNLFRAEYPETELILVPESYWQSHPELEIRFKVQDERPWADYIYSTERMVKLSGKKLAKKKNLISQFIRNHPDYKVMPISSERGKVIVQFTEKWRRERSAEGIYLRAEAIAIQNTMEMWDQLPVEGIIICLHNRIAAYSIFSRQTSDMATVHFEKFDPDKKGSAQLINWETAKYLQGRYKWINREQDIGLEGLRQAKLSYDPDFLVKFIVAKPLA